MLVMEIRCLMPCPGTIGSGVSKDHLKVPPGRYVRTKPAIAVSYQRYLEKWLKIKTHVFILFNLRLSD
jgi:hypothetical protein